MSKPCAVLFEPRALREMDEVRAWLREHRGGTGTFDAAMARTLDRLASLPRSSPRVRIGARWSRTRRASLGRTGYQLYYRPNIRAKIITVIAIWHERRSGFCL